MVNPYSIIVLGFINAFRRNNNNNNDHNTTEYMNYFLSYSGLILGTGTVMLTTLGISYYFNLKPYTYLKSSLKILTNKGGETETESEPETEPKSYETKYFSEYDKYLEQKKNETTKEKEIYQEENKAHTKECLENMYYSTITEYINETYGNIIMCYDHATQSFAYYAKTANIPYKYLETVARKYVIDTNAPEELYVDIRKEYENAKNKAQDQQSGVSETNFKVKSSTTKTEDTKTDNTDNTDNNTDEEDVFATFKSYNKASNIPVNDIHSVKSKSSSSSSSTPLEAAVLTATQAHSRQHTTETQGSTKTTILREKANRYSYRGKITDFETHHATFLANRRQQARERERQQEQDGNKEDATTEPTPRMSYQEYKKLQIHKKVE